MFLNKTSSIYSQVRMLHPWDCMLYQITTQYRFPQIQKMLCSSHSLFLRMDSSTIPSNNGRRIKENPQPDPDWTIKTLQSCQIDQIGNRKQLQKPKCQNWDKNKMKYKDSRSASISWFGIWKNRMKRVTFSTAVTHQAERRVLMTVIPIDRTTKASKKIDKNSKINIFPWTTTASNWSI